MNETNEHILIHTARHLTGAEIDRLLARYDLSRAVAELLDRHEAENAWYAFEIYCERMSERGSATRHWTRREAYLRAHPVHGPVGPPPAARTWDDDDIPF